MRVYIIFMLLFAIVKHNIAYLMLVNAFNMRGGGGERAGGDVGSSLRRHYGPAKGTRVAL